MTWPEEAREHSESRWKDFYIGVIPCRMCSKPTDSCSGLPCPHCGDNRQMIKDADSARKIAAESSVTIAVTPAITEALTLIEKAARQGRRSTNISSAMPKMPLHSYEYQVREELKRLGFEIVSHRADSCDPRETSWLEAKW